MRLLSAADVAAEKNQQTLIAGIEHFDPSRLKHTETHEKNPLPDQDGKIRLHILLNSIIVKVHSIFDFLK